MASMKPYYIAFVFVFCSFILCIIGFGTVYWFVSQDPDNLFQSIGLWQACFNGYEHTSDLIGKAYQGCWWIFYKEYYYIRTWLMPPWFKACQTISTFGVLFQFLSIALMPMAARESNNVRTLCLTCFSVWMMAACQTITVVIFGVMIGEDRTWMPRYDLDRLGWSYGLSVVSGFFSIFAGISLTTFTLMRKYELLANNGQQTKRMPRI